MSPTWPPVKRCLKLAYADHAHAIAGKRAVYRKYGIEPKTEKCKACDKFHLKSETYPPSKTWRQIAVLLSQGYRHHEIAKFLNMSKKSVDHVVHQMQRDWQAMNTTHLISKLSRYGILEPHEIFAADDQEEFGA